MTAVWKIQTHDTIVWVNQSIEHLKVCGRTRQGLHINPPFGWVQIECFQGPVLTQQFHSVNIFIATVVTCVWIPFRIFVLHDTAQCFDNRRRCEIFGRNQYQRFFLSLFFILDDAAKIGVCFQQRTVQRRRERCRRTALMAEH